MGTAVISNIQRFSLDDGPGIRTTVFFKGCSLRCAWCHNPECLNPLPELQFVAINCTSCGKCAPACPQQAHRQDDGVHTFHRELCTACGQCVSACRHGALQLVGKEYEPSELVMELKKDSHYHISSGGGITFSGGEPALLPEYISEVARLYSAQDISLALDTAGNVPFENYQTLLPHISLFLYDIKCIDNDIHKKWTGSGNRTILHNLQSLDEANADYHIRVPVIPGFNTSLEEQKKIAGFLRSLSHPGVIQLLPYHNHGTGKYRALGLRSKTEGEAPPDSSFMEQALQCYLELGLNAEIP